MSTGAAVRAAGLVLGLLVATPAAAARFPDWANVVAEAADRAPHAEGAVVLLDSWDVRVVAGRRELLHREVLRIDGDKGFDAATVVLRRSQFADVTDIRIWSRDARGHVTVLTRKSATEFADASRNTIDDDRVFVMGAAAVGIGTHVAVEYRATVTADVMQDRIPLGRVYPVARAEVHVAAEPGWRLLARASNGPAPDRPEAEREAQWSWNGLPAVPVDVDGTEGRGLVLVVDYIGPGKETPFRDWGTTARDLARLFDRGAGPEPRIEALARNLDMTGREPVQVAIAAARRVRYFAVSLGWGGWKPRTPEVVLERGFGDCKDKALLAIALLERSGIHAVPVLIRTPELGTLEGAVPGMFHFNHAIVGIPWTGGAGAARDVTLVDAPGIGRLRLLDATLDEHAGQDTMSLLGADGLALDPRTTGLFRVVPPRDAPPARTWRERWTVTDQDAIVASSVLEWTGGREAEYAPSVDATRRRAAVYRELAARRPGIELGEVGAIAEAEGASTCAVSYRWPDALRTAGVLRLLAPGDLVPLRALPVPDADRKTAVPVDDPMSLGDRIEIELPSGWTVTRLPEAVTLDNAAGRARLSVRVAGQQVVIERELVQRPGDLAPSQQADLKALRDALRTLNTITLVLEKR